MEELTTEIVAFLMEALLAGRLTREAACRLVTPWVEGVLPSTPLAEAGAQLLHGFDVIAREGREYHASVVGEGGFLVPERDVSERCRSWLVSVSERGA